MARRRPKKGTLFGKPRGSQVIKAPGSFTAAAHKAGKSVGGEIKSVLGPHSTASTKMKKRAVLARTFRKWAAKRRGRAMR